MAKFKDLKDADIEYLKHMFYIPKGEMKHKEKMEILSSKYKVSGRTIRRWWREELNLSDTYSILPDQLKDAEDRYLDPDTDVVFVAAAQNKTALHLPLWNKIHKYKEFLEAKGKKVEILVSPSRYRNPTSPEEETKKRAVEWWRDEVVPYLHYGKREFGDVVISSDSRVRPTAKNPLTGYEAMAATNHFILPHSKIHFSVLPRYVHEPLRIMATTGFITRKNYSDSKAGDHGHIHHSYGFVVLEKKKDGTCYIPRNVKTNSEGDFTDLIYEVTDDGVHTIQDSLGFVWGDIHNEMLNREFFDTTIDLLKRLKPEKQVLHDVYDGSRVNPHEKKDMFIQRLKILNGKYDVKEEVEEAIDVIGEIKERIGAETYVAISNHDVFLDRYINDGDWKKDLHNSATYLEYAQIQQTVDITKYGSIFGYLVKERYGDDITYINYGESLKIADYQCGAHGDFGVNGSRGNYKTFSRLNSKKIHAHSHSPAIHNGVTVVGITCDKDQYYNRRGLSSWAYAHSVIHNNGKNQLLVFGDDYTLSGLL